jgi:hypothetical protein
MYRQCEKALKTKTDSYLEGERMSVFDHASIRPARRDNNARNNVHRVKSVGTVRIPLN